GTAGALAGRGGARGTELRVGSGARAGCQRHRVAARARCRPRHGLDARGALHLASLGPGGPTRRGRRTARTALRARAALLGVDSRCAAARIAGNQPGHQYAPRAVSAVRARAVDSLPGAPTRATPQIWAGLVDDAGRGGNAVADSAGTADGARARAALGEVSRAATPSGAPSAERGSYALRAGVDACR